MKINWGTSIVLAFVIFIVFIMYFVVSTFTQNDYKYDLVSSQYYEEELDFQNTIDNAENADHLTEKVVFKASEEELKITIPNPNNELIVAKYSFYRPSNDKLDFSKSITSKENTFTVTKAVLVKGRWNVVVTWHYKSDATKRYYKKEQLYF